VKQIINGKTYNTETATRICSLPCSEYPGDFSYHDTDLYRSPKGVFFIAGKGGAMSMWSTPAPGGGTGGGSGIRLVDEDEARFIMEEAECDEADFEKAGLPVEEG
jgi:hypothetical protein